MISWSMTLPFGVNVTPHSRWSGLQGHAAINQDLLIAAGAVHLKGSDGLSAVDDDIQAVVSCLSIVYFIIWPSLTLN